MQCIPLLISLSLSVLLYLLSIADKSFKEEVSTIDKKEYPFRDIMPIGFLIIKKVGLNKFKAQNRSLYQKMFSMYGLDVEKKFRYHIAYKIALAILFINAVYLLILTSGSINVFLILLGPVAGVAVYVLADSLEEETFKKRSKEIRYDFPEFLTKLVLLINAGLTFDRAWKVILEGAEEQKNDSYLIKEFTKTYKDMSSNIPKSKCLNDLSKRCKIQEVSKFTSIVLQNLNKGSDNMVMMLQQLSDECWNERKQMAKQKGEEASTKLLFPMMLMLGAVFLVVLVPAMMQLMSM